MNYKNPKEISEFPFRIKIPDFVSFILEKLNSSGFKAFIVGGAIRDALLDREAIDWDITTEASVSEIKSVFKDIRQFSLKHETVTLMHSGIPFEVTAMKGTEGKKDNIFKDLSHRDFTLNAMAYDEKKSIVLDPLGGAGDIKRKTIKAVDDPLDRFKEDPLRMLRAVRFAGELDFTIDKNTFDVITSFAPALTSVSVERIRDELIRIIMCKKSSNLLELLCETGLMEYILPELLEGYGVEQNSWHMYTVFKHTIETVDNIPSNNILRLAALLHDIGKPRVREKVNDEYHFYNHERISSSMAKEIMERLRFSREEIKKVSTLISLHMIDYNKTWGDAAVRRLIRQAGWDNIDELLALRKADIIAHGVADNKLDHITHLEQRIEKMKNDNISVHISDLAIDGKTVMDIMGLDPGPEVGKLLRKLLEYVMDHPESNSEEKLIDILRGAK